VKYVWLEEWSVGEASCYFAMCNKKRNLTSKPHPKPHKLRASYLGSNHFYDMQQKSLLKAWHTLHATSLSCPKKLVAGRYPGRGFFVRESRRGRWWLRIWSLFEPPLVPATPGREGGQWLILVTPNPNQSRVPVGWMGVNNELCMEAKEDPGFWEWVKGFIGLKGFALPRIRSNFRYDACANAR
jgi:hypothetical protein